MKILRNVLIAIIVVIVVILLLKIFFKIIGFIWIISGLLVLGVIIYIFYQILKGKR